ncbi:uncharacterized protein [Watersipora subatra]|uniref:uncharacterized protein n=1 Tax=Watersipora subatra TaxID=2589382 RepID=UPI00355C321C
MKSQKTNVLPLKTLVIGCKCKKSFDQLSRAIVSTLVLSTPPNSGGRDLTSPTAITSINAAFVSAAITASKSTFVKQPTDQCVQESAKSNINAVKHNLICDERKHPNVKLQFMIGNRLSDAQSVEIVFEIHRSVPSLFLELCGLYSSTSDTSGYSDEFTVLSMTPFKRGYINHMTELVIIMLSTESALTAPTSHLKMPIVSDFLVQYKSYISRDDSYVMSVQLLGEDGWKGDHSVNSQDYRIFVSSKFAHDFGVMHDGFVTVKLKDSKKRLRRYLKVAVSSHMNDEEWVRLSPICWFNLGGSELSLERLVSIKRASPGDSSVTMLTPDSPSSASMHECCADISLATRVTVARVNLAEDLTLDASITEPLQDYFLTDRYFCVNDVFTLQIPLMHTGQIEMILMKVVKINNSSKTTSTYRVNRQTTLYEGPSVHSYIPSGVLHRRSPKIGPSFRATRDNLINLLKPFVEHNWLPNPFPFILLSGLEGSGRSLIIRQISSLLQCNYVEVNCVNLVTDTANSTENRIKEVLTQAQLVSPAILSFRNIDVLTKEEPMNMENPRIAQYFYKQLRDTLSASNYPLLVFGTCHKLKSVSETIRETALHEVTIESPGVLERLNMLEELAAHFDFHSDVSLKYLAEHTAGFLYGDLKALMEHARRNSMARAYSLCKKELGYICEESIDYAGILTNRQDFQKGLETIQSLQSLDLGAPKIPNVKWSDIGGLQDVKGDILDTIQLPLRHPELFISAMRRSGILLYGPPGTGKTLLAKAVATECALNFFSVKGPELINMYVGQSEENIRQVFHKARSASPCVVFFDELDSLAPNRGRSGDSGGVMDRVVSQLLAELDGLVKSCDVFAIGATNRPDLLDPALLRPGRFDKLVYVGISSTASERLTVLKAISRKFNLDPDCDLELVSQRCPSNMTGADLYALCADAMTNAIKRQIDLVQAGKPIEECKLHVKLSDFLEAIEQATPSLSVVEIERYEQVRKHFSSGTRKRKEEIK